MADQDTTIHETIIVGAGLSGLYAAALLKTHGLTPIVLEARDRIGGRILSFRDSGQAYELGPSWVWPGQPRIAALLKDYGIASFPQHSDGALIYQQADGHLDRHDGLAPMANALRIDGGPSALIDALETTIGKELIKLEHDVREIDHLGDHIRLRVQTPQGGQLVYTRTLALGLPPRLCTGLVFTPALPGAAFDQLNALPTWMAGHAKFTAIYDRPIWREAGLSGDAMSRRGPLVEIHDVSPLKGGAYALFGFLGLDAQARARIDKAQLKTACLDQLTDIFGTDAGSPRHAMLQDWSTEPYTAAQADLEALRHHPAYGLKLDLNAPWADRLHFIATETAHENGGLIEGALNGGSRFAAHLLKGRIQDKDFIGDPRRAKMSWDWLGG